MGRSIQDQGFRIVLKNIQAPVWHWNRCWLRLRGPIYCLPKTIEGYQSCDSVPWKQYQPNLVLLNVLTNCERRNEMCWLFRNALQTPETEVRVRSRQLSQWCWAAAGSMSISNRKTTPWGQKQIKNNIFLFTCSCARCCLTCFSSAVRSTSARSAATSSSPSSPCTTCRSFSALNSK